MSSSFLTCSSSCVDTDRISGLIFAVRVEDFISGKLSSNTKTGDVSAVVNAVELKRNSFVVKDDVLPAVEMRAQSWGVCGVIHGRQETLV